MKKILLVTRPIAPPWDEASKNFAFTLAKNIPDCEFTLLTAGNLANLPANVITAPIYSSPQFTFWQKMKLMRYLKKHGNSFDVVHYLFTPTKLNARLAKIKDTKTIQTVATLREDLFAPADFKKILFADSIITYSNYAKEKLHQFGFTNVTKIYPGIDTAHFSPAAKNATLQQTLGITADDFVVIYPGEYARLGATEGLVSMIIAHKDELTAKHIKIILANRLKNKKDVRIKEQIQNQLKVAGVIDQVSMDAFATDMPKLYNLADLVIFPATTMQGKFDVPLAIIEAMSCGKTVITSDLPILREFLTPEVSPQCTSGDFEDLWNKIIELHSNQESLRLIDQAARQYAVNNFDIKQIATQYKQIYDQF